MVPSHFTTAVVLDFEASCLPSDRSFPIEIGLGFVATGQTVSIPIRPTEDWLHSWTWDANAEAVHGWTPAELLRVGLPVDQAFARFRALTAGHQIYSDHPDVETAWLLTLRDAAEPRWWSRLSGTDRVLHIERLTSAALGHAAPPDPFELHRAAEAAAWTAFPREHRANQDAGRWAYHIRHILGATP